MIRRSKMKRGMRALFEDLSGYVLNADAARSIEEDFAASVAQDFGVETRLPWRKGRQNVFRPAEPQIIELEAKPPVPAADIIAYMKMPVADLPDLPKPTIAPEPVTESGADPDEVMYEKLRNLFGRLDKPKPLTFS